MIKPAVPKLPTFALAVALSVVANTPVVLTLPAPTLPVAVIRPAVPKLPTLALPETDTLDNVPKLVTLG